MPGRKLLNVLFLVTLLISLAAGASGAAFARTIVPQDSFNAAAKPPDPQNDKYEKKYQKWLEKQEKRITSAQRKDEAALSYQKGKLNPLMIEAPAAVTAAAAAEAAAVAALPGEAPRYFSHPNYANSPYPTVNQPATPVGNDLIERVFATDNDANVFVALTGSPLPAGFLTGFQTLNQAAAGASFQPSAGLSFHAYVLRPTTVADVYSVVFDSGLLTVPPLTDPLVSEIATFGVNNLTVQLGDVLAFYGQGIPLNIGAGTDFVSVPAYVPALPLQGSVIEFPSRVYPDLGQLREYSFGAQVVEPVVGAITGGIRKFVDGLPGLTPANSNSLVTPAGDPDGQYISVASADTTTYAGADYYEIAVVQYREQMHTDLPPTLLRGYVQLAGKVPCDPGEVELLTLPLHPSTPTDLGVSTGYCGTDYPHYLGATIAATKDTPVRILFRNLLPTDQGGNLFIPTDITVMGSGMGPSMWGMPEPLNNQTDPQCGRTPKPDGCYTENRAVLHLHGGRTPWISDGTPHQWITPWGERDHLTDNGANPPIPVENKGDSVAYVPDMWFDATTGDHDSWLRGRYDLQRAERDELPGRGRADLLLHQPAERPDAVLPRSRLGHHPPERLRGRGRRLPDHR